jgi:hypothetical protein
VCDGSPKYAGPTDFCPNNGYGYLLHWNSVI